MGPSLISGVLSWVLPQDSFLFRLELVWGLCPPRLPFRARPVSSPPQLEPALLPSPSCYLIAEEPELAPPRVWLLCRQDQCCFLCSAALQEGSQWGHQES